MTFYIKKTWTEKYLCLYCEICLCQPKEQIRQRGPESLGHTVALVFVKLWLPIEVVDYRLTSVDVF